MYVPETFYIASAFVNHCLWNYDVFADDLLSVFEYGIIDVAVARKDPMLSDLIWR